MPSRYIREGWLDSDAIARAAALPPAGGGPAAEVLFLRLCLTADDWGRCDGRPVVVIRTCWPAQDEFDGAAPSRTQIVELLAVLAREGLIVPYQVEEKPYLAIPRFGQRTRAVRSKFPAPPGEVPTLATKPAGNWRDPEPGNAGPQPVSGTSGRLRTGSGQPADKVRTTGRSPQAGSRTLSRTGLATGGQTAAVDNSQPVDKPARGSDPPGGSVASFAKAAVRKIPAFTATAPDDPEEIEEHARPPQHPLGAQPDQERIRTGEAHPAPPANGHDDSDLDQQAQHLGMQRMALESDSELQARISARLALG